MRQRYHSLACYPCLLYEDYESSDSSNTSDLQPLLSHFSDARHFRSVKLTAPGLASGRQMRLLRRRPISATLTHVKAWIVRRQSRRLSDIRPIRTSLLLQHSITSATLWSREHLARHVKPLPASPLSYVLSCGSASASCIPEIPHAVSDFIDKTCLGDSLLLNLLETCLPVGGFAHPPAPSLASHGHDPNAQSPPRSCFTILRLRQRSLALLH